MLFLLQFSTPFKPVEAADEFIRASAVAEKQRQQLHIIWISESSVKLFTQKSGYLKLFIEKQLHVFIFLRF